MGVAEGRWWLAGLLAIGLGCSSAAPPAPVWKEQWYPLAGNVEVGLLVPGDFAMVVQGSGTIEVRSSLTNRVIVQGRVSSDHTGWGSEEIGSYVVYQRYHDHVDGEIGPKYTTLCYADMIHEKTGESLNVVWMTDESGAAVQRDFAHMYEWMAMHN